jgi:hypothetical protein
VTFYRVVFDVVMVGSWVRALVVLAAHPASRWPAGWWGKTAGLAVAALFWLAMFGLVVPWGAALVWWRIVRRGSDPFELPMADGRRSR